VTEMPTSLLARCAMSEVTTFDWPFERDVAAYSEVGFGAIGVWQNKLMGGPFVYSMIPVEPIPPPRLDAAVHAIRTAGLGVSSLICAGDFTQPNPVMLKRRIEHGQSAVDAVRRLEGGCLVIIPGGLHGGTREEAMERCSRALRLLSEIAVDAGVRLAVEPLHPRDTDFVNTLGDAIELTERVNHEACGVFIDTWQLWETPDLLREIPRAAGRIYGLHVADSPAALRSNEDRSVPGEGVIPLVEIVGAVFDAGYDGWIDVELMSRELWALDYHDVLARCATGITGVLEAVEARHGD
jgi:sugar phosphate isomerase/epimerase